MTILSDFDRVLVINDGEIVNDGPPHVVVPWYEDCFR